MTLVEPTTPFVFKMLFYLLLLGTAFSAPTDEFQSLIHDGELVFKDDPLIMKIVPSGYSPQKVPKQLKHQPLSDIIDQENENYQKLVNAIESGVTLKGLTFNIFNDEMREAAVAMFRLLQNLKGDVYNKACEWLHNNVNTDMFQYARRLAVVHDNKIRDSHKEYLTPPFLTNPNFFVNGETIRKAAILKINNGYFNMQDAEVNQFYRTNDIISINTNYSGWNLEGNGYEDEVNYFREDIGLNSYYYGLNLLNPFWMSNEELEDMNSRHAEYYYYNHQQLLARYRLEKEHIPNSRNDPSKKRCRTDYNPYLIHDNGLPFPIRSSLQGEWNDDNVRLKSIDIGIKECISRGLIIMQNATGPINLTEDNYVDLLAKLIRANLDGVKTAKIVRSLFGYGTNRPALDKYNPAPSLLHFPETTLRDPIFWFLIDYIMLTYFNEYEKQLEPFNLSEYETDEFIISDASFSKITTYFNYYQFSINNALRVHYNQEKSPIIYSARQKRLDHLPITFNFTVESKNENHAVVRLFLGPLCDFTECWKNHSRFFELDNFTHKFVKGASNLSWSPNLSNRLSFDESYNLEMSKFEEKSYSMFKFPKSLLIPRGLPEGLNLTLFIIIIPTQVPSRTEYSSQNRMPIFDQLDTEPLGFPFHRRALYEGNCSFNFKFYNITIFHKMDTTSNSGYFSNNLY